MSDKENVDFTSKVQQTCFEDYIHGFRDLISNQGLNDLKIHERKLKFLCLNFDPFDSGKQSLEVENILNDYELEHHLGSPFEFTNIILQLLDILEESIKNKVH